MTDARDARTLTRPLEAVHLSRPASSRLMLAQSTCHGSCERQIEQGVGLVWNSSDTLSTGKHSGESSMDVTTSHEPDASRMMHGFSMLIVGRSVAHGASKCATVLTALPHRLAGEACRKPGSAYIRANLLIVQRVTHGSAGQ